VQKHQTSEQGDKRQLLLLLLLLLSWWCVNHS
jgi:hypothetical protein